MTEKIPVTFERAKLCQLANKLERMHKDDIEILWLSAALLRIGSGKDANIELGVHRKKGQDDKKAKKSMEIQMAIRWIAGRMNLDGEPPPDKAFAIREAANLFKLNEENLKRQCPTVAKLKALVEFDWDSQRPKIN
jgi:hypothetical protein